MHLIDINVFLERERQIHEGTVDYNVRSVLKTLDDTVTDYAILSHRWNDEVDYLEITGLTKMENPDDIRERSGYQKIVKSCQKAKNDGLEWLWVDTCCIDKRNSTELSEALNSMYRWYENLKRCYAYLHDVDTFPTTPDNETFAGSEGWPEWFSRGWTLQELIAPADLQFFNKDWHFIGDKRSFASTLEKITRIPSVVLEEGLVSYRPSVAQVMSWAADRRTTRVEDRAYSLMGLLDVNMPMLYGEGKKAFLRLQHEVIRKSNDQTIFAWLPTSETPQTCGVLAADPSLFRDCHDIVQIEPREFYSKLSDLWTDRATNVLIGNLLVAGCLLDGIRTWWRWTRDMRASHAFTTTNAGIQVLFPTRRYPGCPLILHVALACRSESSSNPIIIDVVSWRSRYYRYIGKVGLDPVLSSYQHSQLILAYEPAGVPSGIVNEEADGSAALLLSVCAAKTAADVADRSTQSIGVTITQVHRILASENFRFFASFIFHTRGFSFFFSLLLIWVTLLARDTKQALILCVMAAIAIAFFWILSEASTTTLFTTSRTAEAPPFREYILASDREIVLLQGESAAITSIIRSEAMTPLHALWRMRLLIICMYGILVVSVTTTVGDTAAVTIIAIFQAFIAFLLCRLSFVRALRKPLYGHTLMRYLCRLKLTKYMFGTRASGVVFTLLLLQTEKVVEVMDELLPTPNSRVWKEWKTIVLDRIRRMEDFDIGTSDWDDGTWTDKEKEMLTSLFQDARNAHRVFERHLAGSVRECPPV